MPSLTVYITATADDKYNGGTGNIADNIQWGSTNNAGGMRFQNVTIPKGSTILTAHIHGRARWNPGNFPVYAHITCKAADNAGEWANNTEGRPYTCTKTTAYTQYDVSSFSSGTWYQTPDFAAAVQEVTDRAGWSSGNALAVVIADDGSTSGYYVAFDDISTNATYAAYIDITYTEPSAGKPCYYYAQL